MERSYFGCLVRQRESAESIALFVFTAKVSDVKGWTTVRRVRETPVGTQRLYRKTRAHAIARYFEKSPINTIPSSLLVAFGPGGAEFIDVDLELPVPSEVADATNGCGDQLQWGVLKFDFDPDAPEEQRPALIVDGQHRLSGMSEFAGEDLPVVLIALVDAPLLEQAFQFIVINSKAVKVPVDNAKSIIANVDDGELQTRLLDASVNYAGISSILKDFNDSPLSPFQGLLKWPYNREGKQLIELSAVEQALRYLRTVFQTLEGDRDSQFEVFCSIWSAVKDRFPDFLEKEGIFVSKVNLTALNEFMVDRLKAAWEFNLVDIFEPKEVRERVASIVEHLPPEFWNTPWAIKIQDNSNVRSMIKADLSLMADNAKLQRPWFQDLSVIEEP